VGCGANPLCDRPLYAALGRSGGGFAKAKRIGSAFASPALALGPRGDAIVAFGDRYAVRHRGGFGRSRPIPDRHAQAPAVAAGGHGIALVAWLSRTNAHTWLRVADVRGTRLARVRTLARATHTGINGDELASPIVAVDGRGAVCVVTGKSGRTLVFTRARGHGFGRARRVAIDAVTAVAGSPTGGFALAGLRVAGSASDAGPPPQPPLDVQFASADNGGRFGRTRTLASGHYRNPQLAYDDAGGLFVGWNGEGRVTLRYRSRHGGFAAPLSVAAETTYFPGLAAGGHATAVLSWTTGDVGDMRLEAAIAH
jgi:hypothetical protein